MISKAHERNPCPSRHSNGSFELYRCGWPASNKKGKGSSRVDPLMNRLRRKRRLISAIHDLADRNEPDKTSLVDKLKAELQTLNQDDFSLARTELGSILHDRTTRARPHRSLTVGEPPHPCR